MAAGEQGKRRLSDDPAGSFAILRRLFAERGRRYMKGYALALLFMGIMAATTTLSAYVMKHVTNELFVSKDLTQIYLIGLFVIAIYLLKGAATYGQTMTLSRVGNSIVASVQRDMYAKLLQLGMDFYSANQSSMIIAQVSQNAEQARRALDLIVTRAGRDALTLVGLLAVMIVQEPLLSVIALLGMPAAVLGVSRLVRRAKRVARQQVHSQSAVVNVLQETMSGIRIIKTFGLERLMHARMDAAVDDVRIRANKMASLGARTGPIMETLGGIAIGLVIMYGGYSVVIAERDPGSFFAFITALLLAYDPAKRLARFNVELAGALTGTRMMFEMLDLVPSLRDAPEARPLVVERGEIRFDHIRFAYRPGEVVLDDLSLAADAHKTLALVGPSGSGKSTIISLVPRLFDPQAGRILIDGQDVAGVALSSLRAAVAYVGQDTFLFDDTIKENIRFGKPDATMDEIERAARLAHADQFIKAFPQGYDTRVGENGTQLSGGQRQRVAIARAILKDAPILLLDEATSALDTESEQQIQRALEELRKGRTTIVIAHRLSTVRSADRIAVVLGGRIVEEGKHRDLLARGETYAKLHELQFAEQDRPEARGEAEQQAG